MNNKGKSTLGRLERLWAGDFGDRYTERNNRAWKLRGAFWSRIMRRCRPARVLEVGCNLGGNLRWVARHAKPRQVFGVDINQSALERLRTSDAGINAVWSRAEDLPFRDSWFDLSFTMGVLIHQSPKELPAVMKEVLRTSRRWVLCGEYYSPTPAMVPYRGHSGALFKRDYGALYKRLDPRLRLAEKGFLDAADGFDAVTYWLFEKPFPR